MQRKFPRQIKRVVIKIGSSVIATYKMQPKMAHLASLVDQICKAQDNGVEIVLVSSGAIVLGMGELNRTKRPSDLASLQALAAIGQASLMKTYIDLFKKNNRSCAQVLLTWDDFDNRTRYNNASNTFQAILEKGVVPVVNENDTISTDEIKFGDNDKLSALVAGQVKADLLIILSDVEGFYDLSGKEKKLFDEIKEITQEIEGLAGGSNNKHMSKGGMSAKLNAIKIASSANVPCIIAHGETEDVLLRILKGEKIGTFFGEKEDKLLSRKHWISFGAKPKGKLVIDDGAKKAILNGGKSLLLVGVVSCDGYFKKDDIVVVEDKEGSEIARGIVNYSSAELNKIDDKKGKHEVIHVDDLVLNQR